MFTSALKQNRAISVQGFSVQMFYSLYDELLLVCSVITSFIFNVNRHTLSIAFWKTTFGLLSDECFRSKLDFWFAATSQNILSDCLGQTWSNGMTYKDYCKSSNHLMMFSPDRLPSWREEVSFYYQPFTKYTLQSLLCGWGLVKVRNKAWSFFFLMLRMVMYNLVPWA